MCFTISFSLATVWLPRKPRKTEENVVLNSFNIFFFPFSLRLTRKWSFLWFQACLTGREAPEVVSFSTCLGTQNDGVFSFKSSHVCISEWNLTPICFSSSSLFSEKTKMFRYILTGWLLVMLILHMNASKLWKRISPRSSNSCFGASTGMLCDPLLLLLLISELQH